MLSDTKVEIKINTNTSVIPTKGSKEAAGYDLYADEFAHIMPGETRAVDCGIAIKIPTGFYGKIAGRSGLALFNSIFVQGGIIDSDHRGNVRVILHNASSETFHVAKQARIGQIIIMRHAIVDWEEYQGTNVDWITLRGEDGFGSTGA